MTQPPPSGLVPCPACRRHVDRSSAACPFCNASLLGRGFGSSEATPGPIMRPEATLYGLPPVTTPREQDGYYPMPAYGLAPSSPSVWVPRLLVVILVLVVLGALAWFYVCG